jgi:hypothetical protein
MLTLAFAGPPVPTVSGDEVKVCPVHHVPLKKDKLEIIYGLVVDSCDTSDRRKASERYFPFDNAVAYGGCVIFEDSPKYKEVRYCPKCREVEKTWPCLETRDTPMISTLPALRITSLPTRP